MESGVFIVATFSEHFSEDFAYSFLAVLFEGLPFILVGTLISGFIDVYLPAGALEKFLPKNRWASVFVCGLHGLILPVCECTVVPVIRRLVAKGLPIGSAFAYMLAAPIVNPITFMSTYTAFAGESLEMAISRMLLGYLVAITVGVLILFLPLEKVLKATIIRRLHFSNKGHSEDLQQKREEKRCCDHHGHDCSSHHHDHHHDTHSNFERLVGAIRTAVKDFIDVSVYFVIGISVMTFFKLASHTNDLMNYLAEDGSLLEGTAFMIGLSFVLSLCSTSDAFVVATSFGRIDRVPKMAFLVFGPMMDIKLLFLYQTLMKRKFIIGLCFILFILVTLVCMLWGNVYPDITEWLNFNGKGGKP